MTYVRELPGVRKGALFAFLLGVIALGSSPAYAATTAITSDGTLGTTVTPSGNLYDIDGGTIKGTNQFHSFDQFSIGAGDIASFNGPVGTQNVISRVTGGKSDIDGTIRSTIDGANLWFLNPAGIMFGQNAQLDITGSFHASTAEYLKLSDGGIFYADLGHASVLTSAPPAAFGFLTSNPAALDVNTSSVLIGAQGETLSFVGGAVNVGAADGSAPGYVAAPVGRVNLVSIASTGEAAFDGTGFNVDSFAQLGDINIAGGSIIDGKEIVIRGGNLTINDSLLGPGVFTLFGLPAPLPDGGEVNIKVTGDLNILGTPGGSPALFGFASGVFVYAGGDGATVLSPGNVPDITIEADNLHMSGTTGLQNNRVGPGLPGDITVTANTATLENGSNIVILNAYEGAAGNILVNAPQVTLSGDGTPNPAGFEGIASQGTFNPLFFVLSADAVLTDADSGNIAINASRSLSVGGTAQITTDSKAFGRGGDITINAGDMNLASTGDPEAGGILAQSLLAGDAGNITISATGSIQVSNGFRISATTGGSGNGGAVQITAAGGITLTGANSRILSGTNEPPNETLNEEFSQAFQGISYDDIRTNFIGDPDASLMDVLGFLNAALGFNLDTTPGDAGGISITTPLLTMNADTRIEASTGWEGNAGAIVANVNSLSLNNGASIRNRSGIQLLTGDFAIGPGNAGTVNIAAADTISVSGHSPTSGAGSAITTSTLGDGKGGDVVLSAAQNVNITNGGSVSADSLALAATDATGGVGGDTGSIKITAGNSITLSNGSISTQAAQADGGDIKLTAPNIVQLTNSDITTSVGTGTGGGGNINVDPQFLVLNNSQITANAFGGPGGNISLTANNFVPSADSVVSASSALSTQGTIVIESPENDIAGSIAQLPQSIVDVSGLLPERCAARHAGGAQSSFVVAGRGGLPTNPDNYLPSFNAGSGPLKSGGTATPRTSLSELGYADQTIVAMAGWGCPR